MEFVNFWGLGGPGRPENPSNKWPLKRPTTWLAVQTPNIGDFRSPPGPSHNWKMVLTTGKIHGNMQHIWILFLST